MKEEEDPFEASPENGGPISKESTNRLYIVGDLKIPKEESDVWPQSWTQTHNPLTDTPKPPLLTVVDINQVKREYDNDDEGPLPKKMAIDPFVSVTNEITKTHTSIGNNENPASKGSANYEPQRPHFNNTQLKKLCKMITQSPKCLSESLPPPVDVSTLIITVLIESPKPSLSLTRISNSVANVFPYFNKLDRDERIRSVVTSLVTNKNLFCGVLKGSPAAKKWSLKLDVASTIKRLKDEVKHLSVNSQAGNKKKVNVESNKKSKSKPSLINQLKAKLSKNPEAYQDESKIWDDSNLLKHSPSDTLLETECKNMMLNVNSSSRYSLPVLITIAIALSPKGYLSLKGINKFIDKFFPSCKSWKQYIRSTLRLKKFIKIGNQGLHWTINSQASLRVLDKRNLKNDVPSTHTLDVKIDKPNDVLPSPSETSSPSQLSVRDVPSTDKLDYKIEKPNVLLSSNESFSTSQLSVQDSLSTNKLDDKIDNPNVLLSLNESSSTSQLSVQVPEPGIKGQEKMNTSDSPVCRTEELQPSTAKVSDSQFDLPEMDEDMNSTEYLRKILTEAFSSVPKGYMTYSEITKYIEEHYPHFKIDNNLKELLLDEFTRFKCSSFQNDIWALHYDHAEKYIQHSTKKDEEINGRFFDFNRKIIGLAYSSIPKGFLTFNEISKYIKEKGHFDKRREFEQIKQLLVKEFVSIKFSSFDDEMWCLHPAFAEKYLNKQTNEDDILRMIQNWKRKPDEEFVMAPCRIEQTFSIESFILDEDEKSKIKDGRGTLQHQKDTNPKPSTSQIQQDLPDQGCGNINLTECSVKLFRIPSSKLRETSGIKNSKKFSQAFQRIPKIDGCEVDFLGFSAVSESLLKAQECLNSLMTKHEQQEGNYNQNERRNSVEKGKGHNENIKISNSNWTKMDNEYIFDCSEDECTMNASDFNWNKFGWRGWDPLSKPSKTLEKFMKNYNKNVLTNTLSDTTSWVGGILENIDEHQGTEENTVSIKIDKSDVFQTELQELMEDINFEEPPYSYTQLAAMALCSVSSTSESVPFSEVCRIVEDSFPYYGVTLKAWKTALRDTMEFNSAFEKTCKSTSSCSKRDPTHEGCWSVSHSKAAEILERALEFKRNRLSSSPNPAVTAKEKKNENYICSNQLTSSRSVSEVGIKMDTQKSRRSSTSSRNLKTSRKIKGLKSKQSDLSENMFPVCDSSVNNNNMNDEINNLNIVDPKKEHLFDRRINVPDTLTDLSSTSVSKFSSGYLEVKNITSFSCSSQDKSDINEDLSDSIVNNPFNNVEHYTPEVLIKSETPIKFNVSVNRFESRDTSSPSSLCSSTKENYIFNSTEYSILHSTDKPCVQKDYFHDRGFGKGKETDKSFPFGSSSTKQTDVKDPKVINILNKLVDSSINCKCCDPPNSFGSEEELSRHVNSKSPIDYPTFKCKFCCVGYYDEEKLKSHVLLKHS